MSLRNERVRKELMRDISEILHREIRGLEGVVSIVLFHLPEEEKAKLKGLPTSLEAALDALEADHDYLTAGGVFPEELLKNFIKNKRAECSELSKIPHPAEFDKYYNL